MVMRKYVLLIGVTILCFLSVMLFNRKTYSKVILISGTSSAGKSSIIEELQKLVGKEYLVVKIDNFDFDKTLNQNLEQKAKTIGWDTKEPINDFLDNYILKQTGKYSLINTPLSTGTAYDIQKDIVNVTYLDFFEYAKNQAQNNNIIIDTVFDTVDNYDQISRIMHNAKMTRILVYCPLDVIQERIEKRNMSGKPEEKRNAWQAFVQFTTFYKVQESPKDQVVDTIAPEKILNSLKKTITDFMRELEQKNLDDIKFKQATEDVRYFSDQFIKRFNLESDKEITIVTKNHYDIILNTATTEPAVNAKKILHYINSNKYLFEK